MQVVTIIAAAKKQGIPIVGRNEYRSSKNGLSITGGTTMHPFDFSAEVKTPKKEGQYGGEWQEEKLIEAAKKLFEGFGFTTEISTPHWGGKVVLGHNVTAKEEHDKEQEEGRLAHLKYQLEKPWRMVYNRDEYRYVTQEELMEKAEDLRASKKRIGLWGGKIELFHVVENSSRTAGYERVPLVFED